MRRETTEPFLLHRLSAELNQKLANPIGANNRGRQLPGQLKVKVWVEVIVHVRGYRLEECSSPGRPMKSTSCSSAEAASA